MNETTTATKELFPQRLKEAIDTLGIKQVEFANRIGAKPQNVNHWLKGEAEPNAQTFIEMILQFPEINWLYVFRGEEFGAVKVGSKDLLFESVQVKILIDKIKGEYEQDLSAVEKKYQYLISENDKARLQTEVELLREINRLLQEKKP